MKAIEKQIRIYKTADGRTPFTEWILSLRDLRARQKIQARIDRLSLGNPGDWRSVGEGVCELKINFGAGYRVYFGQVGNTIIVLLCGGDKSSQEHDIRQAKEFWKSFKDEGNYADR